MVTKMADDTRKSFGANTMQAQLSQRAVFEETRRLLTGLPAFDAEQVLPADLQRLLRRLEDAEKRTKFC